MPFKIDQIIEPKGDSIGIKIEEHIQPGRERVTTNSEEWVTEGVWLGAQSDWHPLLQL